MLKEINKELDKVAEFDHSNNKNDDIEIAKIAFKCLALLLSIRMSFPFKSAANKLKWQGWIDRLKSGEVLLNIIN